MHLIKSLSVVASGMFVLVGCGAAPIATNTNTAGLRNTNTVGNTVNTNTSVNTAIPPFTTSSVTEAKEPESYQANVALKLEVIGSQQNMATPTLNATVARTGSDRRMEVAIPLGGRVVFLDKGGKNYIILPEKKQYAELNRESLGFDVRRMLMPEQIVEQLKGVQGLERVGEEKYNGRDAIKYRYGAVAETQTKVGQVATESFLIVDKETGLPLRSETLSKSQGGGNVQGYSGVRVITEITDIKIDPAAELFAEPAGMEKIDASQVKAQVDMVFNSIAMLLGEMMKQGAAQTAPAR
ncbi:MAG: hypothetical protein WKF34_12555 [Pyrinomonadaceae bacterium]